MDPEYDGNPEKLPKVLSALKVCKTLITTTNNQIVVDTIISHMEGKAAARKTASLTHILRKPITAVAYARYVNSLPA